MKSGTSNYTLHNKVKLISGGRQFFELLERMIDESKYSLHFQTYIFDGDHTGTNIVRALIRAAQRDVKVFLLVDGYASQDLPESLIGELKSAGVNFRWFGPILKNRYLYFGRRLHHKVVVSDGLQCLIGGRNISDKYDDLPGSIAWMDWAIWVEGEASLVAFEICSRRAKSRWNPWFRKPIVEKPTANLPIAKCLTRIRVNDWLLRKKEISRSYIEMLRHARTEVTIMSSYFMPGREFRKGLRLAAKRGVKVRIILAGISDIKLAKQSERYLYGWLLRNKIEIFEYTRTVLHGKIACCDGNWMTVGSYNLNDLSARASVEMNVDVRNAAFAIKTKEALDHIILNDCERITSESEKRTSFVNRIIQKSAYNIFRILLFVFTFYFREQKSQSQIREISSP